MAARVEIPGLAALKRDLKDLEPDIKRILPQEFKQVAEAVVKDARARIPSRSGAAAAGIVAKGTSTGPSIVEKRKPGYLRWLDFGSRNPVFGNPRKVGPWHGSGTGPKSGRFVYPAIAAAQPWIMKAATDAVDQAARKAGFR